jgi:hypothetical protein
MSRLAEMKRLGIPPRLILSRWEIDKLNEIECSSIQFISDIQFEFNLNEADFDPSFNLNSILRFEFKLNSITQIEFNFPP